MTDKATVLVVGATGKVGRLVADTTRQCEVFGPAPTPRHALAAFPERRGYTLNSAEERRTRLAKEAS